MVSRLASKRLMVAQRDMETASQSHLHTEQLNQMDLYIDVAQYYTAWPVKQSM